MHSKREWLAYHQIHKQEGKCGESTLLEILSDSKILMTNIKKEGVTVSLFQTPCKYEPQKLFQLTEQDGSVVKALAASLATWSQMMEGEKHFQHVVL